MDRERMTHFLERLTNDQIVALRDALVPPTTAEVGAVCGFTPEAVLGSLCNTELVNRRGRTGSPRLWAQSVRPDGERVLEEIRMLGYRKPSPTT